MSNLTGEGNLGLMHAVDKFEPERDFRFTTYAACGRTNRSNGP
jgi:RNA polymerase nonessential primary-like sigma factor